MANMNIDLDRLGRLTESDLDDKQERKRLVQYLYQLSEQLKYWQYNLEAENFAPDLQAIWQKLKALAEAVTAQEGAEPGSPAVEQMELKGADVKMLGTNSAEVVGGNSVNLQSGGDMTVLAADGLTLSADELVATGYTLLQLLGMGVLKIDGASAGSFIRLANAAGGAAFMVNGQGTLTANSGHFGALYVGGQDLPTILEAYRDKRLQVSDTQPDGTDIVWVQPTIPSDRERTIWYTGTSASGSFMNEQTNVRTVTCQRDDTAIVALQVKYGVGFRIYNAGDRCHLARVIVELSGTEYGGGPATLTILDESFTPTEYTINTGEYVSYNANAFRTQLTTNLTGGSTITATLTVQFYEAGDRSFQASSFQLKIRGTEGSGYSDGSPIPCDVYYIPEPTP